MQPVCRQKHAARVVRTGPSILSPNNEIRNVVGEIRERWDVRWSTVIDKSQYADDVCGVQACPEE